MGGDSRKCQEFVIGHRYFVGMHMALCHAPASALIGIRVGEYAAYEGNVTASKRIHIDEPNLFGGEKMEGGIQGDVDVMFGGHDQAPNDYLAAVIPAGVPAYRGIVSVALRQVYVGANPYIKPWSFLVRATRYLDKYGYFREARIGSDMNPAWIVFECLTNKEWGLGYDKDEDVNTYSFEVAASELEGEGLGLSLIWDQEVPIEDFVQEILRHVEGVLYIDPYDHFGRGKFALKLIRSQTQMDQESIAWVLADPFARQQVPIIDSQVVIEVESYARRGREELVNTVVVKYKERRAGAWADMTSIPAIGTPKEDGDVAFSPDGNFLAATLRAEDGGLAVIDMRGREAVSGAPTLPHDGRQLAFSPNGEYLAVAHTGAPYISIIRTSDWSVVSGPSVPWNCTTARWSPNGMYLAVGDREYAGETPCTKIFREGSWHLAATLVIDTGGETSEASGFSPDGKYLVTSRDDVMRVWDTAGWSEVVTLGGYGGKTSWSRDGSMLAAVTAGRRIHILNTSNWSVITTLGDIADVYSAAFHPGADVLAVGKHATPRAMFFSAVDWSIVPEVPAVGAPVYGCAWSPHGDHFAALQSGYDHLNVFRQTLQPDQDASVTLHDLGLINEMGGEIVPIELNFPGISTPENANRIAARELNNLSSERAAMVLKCNRKAFCYTIGSWFILDLPGEGIPAMVMVVGEIDYGAFEDGVITIHATQDDIEGSLESFYSDPGETGWEDPARYPVPARYRHFVEATYWYMVQKLGESATVWAEIEDLQGLGLYHAAQPVGDAMDYELDTRVLPGEFAQAGMFKFAPTAVLAAAVSKTAATTVISLSEIPIGEVVPGTYAYLGEEIVEIVAVDQAALTVTVSRGILDTVPQAHEAGARVWFGGQQYPSSDGVLYYEGETLDARALPRTAKGILAGGAAPINSLTFAARHIRPYAPGNFRLNGASFPAAILGGLAISWAHRDRLQQTAYFVTQGEGNIGPEAGTMYAVAIYGEDEALIRSETGLSGTAYTYQEADEEADSPHGRLNGLLTIELWSVRDGYASWQKQTHAVRRAGYGLGWGMYYGGLGA